jgi:Putative Actinobacterial Holin-X, holin superfamily III
MALAKTTRSIPELVGDVVNDFTVLVRKETELARVEMSEKIGDLGIGIGLLVGGSVLLIPALVILLQAAVAGLVVAGIASAWASLIIGGVVLLIGFILLGLGVSKLKSARPVPARTIGQLERDAEMAKSQVRNDNDPSQRAA